MEFRVLGPIEALTGEELWDIGRPRQQAVLAVLLVNANQVVPIGRLIDRVWGQHPPASARNVLYGHIGRLRTMLARADAVEPDSVLRRRSGGYLLTVDPSKVDLHQFRELLTAARRSTESDRAVRLYERADLLWRGPAFAGVTSPWLLSLRATLDNERFSGLLDRNDIFIRQGRSTEILAELRQLSARHPFDERIAHQLVSALYLSGKPAEALSTYAEIRARLANEVGLDPGPSLRALEIQILTGDPELQPPARSALRLTSVHHAADARLPRVPRQLPADISDFTGRDNELARLETLAEDSPVWTITGPPGIGKTALAVHWAHRARDRFPDGELYTDLHKLPADPAGVLARFLRALGLKAAEIPRGLDERAETYRSLVSGRRLLVVIDNANQEASVTPLLPGSTSCGVLVTSHVRLGALAGAHQVELDMLDLLQAIRMLTRIVGAERVRAEPQAALALAELCERWPLALRIAGSKLVAKPHWTLAHLVTRLTDEHSRLDELSCGPLDFRTVLAAAYERLGSGAGQLFQSLTRVADDRRLSLTPTTVRGVAEETFEQLVDARLLEPRSTGNGTSYRVHPLIRLFARERACAPRRDRTLETG
jgi:DNA-binding SARP family transcriptional activator